MTMPHLENCGHKCDGWCAECVKELGETCLRYEETISRLEGGCKQCLLEHADHGDDVVSSMAVELVAAKEEIENLKARLAFGKHLNTSTLTVAQWPEWKQVVLGGRVVRLADIIADFLETKAHLERTVAVMSPRIVKAMIDKHGSLREAARRLDVSPTFLCAVNRATVSLSMLRALKLLKAIDNQPTA